MTSATALVTPACRRIAVLSAFLPACLIVGALVLISAMTQQAAAAAEDELWPVTVAIPDQLIEDWATVDKRAKRNVGKYKQGMRIWLPPESERIAAIMWLSNNTDTVKIGEHQAIRDMAAKHNVALIFLQAVSGALIESRTEPQFAEAHFAALSTAAAEATGKPDLQHAAWITIGKSSRGRFAFQPSWKFPQRMIASISYHAEVPHWPTPEWSHPQTHDASILHCAVNGLTEWDGTWYRAVRPGLLNYHRHTNWLAHQVVIMGVDHGYYPDYYLYPTFQHKMPQKMPSAVRLARCSRVWDYLAAFLDASLSLRLPEQPFPDDAPVTLQQIDRSSGLLIHPRAIEELLGSKWFEFRRTESGDYDYLRWPDEATPVYDDEQGTVPFDQLVKPASSVPADQQRNYLWLANRDLLVAWLDLHNSYLGKDRVLAGLDAAAGTTE